MLTASFPAVGLDWMAWFALIPLLWAIEHRSPFRAFGLGLLTGFAHALSLIYWVVVTLQHYGGINVYLSIAVLLLFCAYLALYPALFAAILSGTGRIRFPVLLMGATWVALEYARAKFLSGFPWCLLGYSQYSNLGLIQIADLVGVYGVSFLIVLVNGVLYNLLFRRPALKRPSFVWEIAFILLFCGSTLYYGHFRLQGEARREKPGSSIRVAIVQANIDQSVKWNPKYQGKTMEVYGRLTRAAIASQAQLIVWPETAVPFFFQNHPQMARRVFDMVRGADVDLIFGSPAFKKEGGAIRYYNRAYHLSSEGAVAGYYNKVHLVPFGEYVPFKKYLFFIQRLVVAAGDFASGEKIEPIRMPKLSAGVLICFEVIFPELARAHTREGAEILVNLTNDAWFGRTSAPFQHLSMAVFRAVENRRPLVRSANTGISAFIAPSGKIMMQGDLFEEEVLVMDVTPVRASAGIYTQQGDLFALLLSVICLINLFHALCYHRFTRGRTREPEGPGPGPKGG